MEQKKGFSLIEVLLSLMLVTTLALALMQLQLQSKLFLNQLLSAIEASTFLDAVDESLLLDKRQPFIPPLPYSLSVTHSSKQMSVQLNGLNSYSLTRVYQNWPNWYATK